MKKIIISILIAIFILSATYFLLVYYEVKEDEDKGMYLIKKIETFRQHERRLPNNLTELGVEEPMNSGPYYEKVDSLHYTIYFVLGFDGYRQYNSKSKEWKYSNTFTTP